MDNAIASNSSCHCQSCSSKFEVLVNQTRVRHDQIPTLNSLHGVHASVSVSILSCLQCEKDVAVNWDGSWKSITEAVQSISKDKSGLSQVQTDEDIVILYVLSQIMYGQYERSQDDVKFCFPGCHDDCNIMWHRGEAVGFFTIKPQGQLYAAGVSSLYQLPVVDLLYVKQAARRCGHALTMVKQVVKRFPDQDIGFSCPISSAMWAVLQNYLNTHRKERRYLWATTFTGGEGDRKNIWLTLRYKERQSPAQNAELTYTEATTSTKY